MSWKKLFERHILDRGYDYYINGVVENIEVKDNTISADVAGTVDYEVEIALDNGKIADMDCTCPYATDGKNCKHMAAVLYEWSEKYSKDEKKYSIDSALFDTEYDITDRRRKMTAIEIIVDNADEKYLKSFLADILAEDERLLRNFYNGVNKYMAEDDIDVYKKQMDSVVDRYYDGEGFIDYYHADDFIDELEEIIESAAYNLTANTFIRAFEVIDYAFEILGKVAIDDSNGGIYYFVDRASRLWSEIITELSDSGKKTAFDWFVSVLENTDKDYLEEAIENIIIEEFPEAEYLQQKLRLAEKMIEKSKKIEYEYGRNHNVGKWTVRYLELLKEKGMSVDILKQECKKYWENSTVREYWIDICIENKNYDEALLVLDESILLDKDYRGLVCEHNKKKKEIYLLQGNKRAYTDQLWKLLLEYNIGDLEIYRELKKQYTADEWFTEREKVFDRLSKHPYIGKLYKEEQLYDRLLSYVMDSHGLNVLQEYENILIKQYPEQILNKYAREVCNMATEPNGRKHYAHLVSILRRMKKMDGGQRLVEQIVLFWKSEYKNRPAMMDELSKLC